MEEEDILQFIADQRNLGKNDQFIGRSLQMRGVSDFNEYLKKKDDTSTSQSDSGEGVTESAQATAPQGGQETGSSDLPVAPQAEPSVASGLSAERDTSFDPITGAVTPWEDTPSNRARLEIDPVHYDAFQKAGFIRIMDGLGSEHITPQIESAFSDFVNGGKWWWNSVDGNLAKISETALSISQAMSLIQRLGPPSQ